MTNLHDWKTMVLDEVITIKHGFAFKSELFADNGKYSLLTPGNFYESGGFRNLGSKQKYYEGPFPKEYLLSKGRLLIVMTEQATGLLGSTLIVPEDNKYLHNQRLGLVEISDNTAINDEFLFHLLNSPLLRRPISDTASGTKVRHTSPSRICEIVGNIPPLPEQKRIATILSTWLRAIDLTERLIAAKKERRTWLMQQLLTGKRRLPGFDGEWREVHLSDVFERVQRSIPDGETPEVLSITAKAGFVSQRVKFSKVIAGKNLEQYVLIRRGEFSYNKGNSLTYPQGCVFPLKEFDEGAVPNVFLSFRAASPEVYPDFYSHFFASGGLNHQLSRVINTGVRNDGLLNLNASDFFNVKVPFPPVTEQEQIAKILTLANNELDLLRTQLEALREQKKGLMQQLLTGKIRVKV